MKEKLMYWMFKKELNELNERHMREKGKELDRLNKSAKLQIEDMKEIYEIPKRIFFLFPNSEIIGIEKNKNDEELYVFKTVHPSGITIYLCGRSYRAINCLPRIMTTLYRDHLSKKDYIRINDIQMQDNEVGNGSIAMKYLIETVKKMDVIYISGELSSVDKDHFDRLEHYYKKFGFKVTFGENRTSGSIKIVL